MRKLIGMHVLLEDTYRQDNQYGNVVACLKVNRRQADAFFASRQPVSMPVLISAKHVAAAAAAKKGRPPLLASAPVCAVAVLLVNVFSNITISGRCYNGFGRPVSMSGLIFAKQF